MTIYIIYITLYNFITIYINLYHFIAFYVCYIHTANARHAWKQAGMKSFSQSGMHSYLLRKGLSQRPGTWP